MMIRSLPETGDGKCRTRSGPVGLGLPGYATVHLCDLAGLCPPDTLSLALASLEKASSLENGTPTMSRLPSPTLCTWILCLAFAGNASATTYYIAANGSDSNSGTSKTAPWAHAPGMANATGKPAANTPGPGDQFIFRGGDTWGPASWPMAPQGTGGSAGNPVYFGVDQAWSVGASWTRPIFSGGGTYPGTQAGGMAGHVLALDYLSNWVVDNIEFTAFFYNNSTSGSGAPISCNNGSTCTNFEVKNCYVHGWTHGSGGGTTDVGTFLFVNGQHNGTSSAHDNVVDGSDTAGDSFGVFSGGPGNIYRNYVSHVVNVVNSNVTAMLNIHDNTFLSTACSFDGVTHGNAIQNNPPSAGVIVYNNLVEHLGACSFPLNMQAGSNSTNYFFNNVYVDVSNIAVSLSTYAGGGVSNATFYAFNNTIEPGSDAAGGTSNAVFSIDGDSNRALYYICNNHGITSGPLTTVYGSGGSYSLACTASIPSTSTYNMVESKATANGQGYTSSQTYPFSPTGSTSPTVGAGTNLISFCNGISDSTAQAACLNDATDGVTEVAGSGGFVVSSPNRTPIAEPTTGAWDIGAYGLGTQVNPPSGLTAVVQ